MKRHHIVAVALAGTAAASALLDTVILAVTGHRTFITDDAQGSTAAAVGMSVFLGAVFGWLALVVARETPRFAAGNRATRLTRRPLLAGLVLLSVGSVLVHPARLLAGMDEGPVTAVSDLLAGLSLLLTFGAALVLGLATVRDNPLGVGARVLALMVPVILLTALLGLVASAYASPVFATMFALVGIALLGVGPITTGAAGTGAPSRSGYRLVPEEDGMRGRPSYPELMIRLTRRLPRLRPSSPLVTLAVAAVAAGLLTLGRGYGPAEWLFGTVVLGLLGSVVRQALIAWWRAGQETSRARQLDGIDAGTLARGAVQEERRRLAADIAERLHRALTAVAGETRRARAAEDPGPALLSIHREAQQAASELRRQLGLLREPAEPEPAGDPAVPRRRPHRGDVLIALGVAALALAEAVAYPRVEGLDRGWTSVLLTVLAGSTVVGLRTAPGQAALACGSLYLLGWLFDDPVVGGFWSFAAVCGVLWQISARVPTGAGRPVTETAQGAYLFGCATVTGWLLDRDNVALFTVTMLVAVVGGLALGTARRRAATAQAAAGERARSLAEATRSAVESERAAFAREIHDVVSHAVGVIAVQSAAAQVSWPGNPVAVTAALDVIDSTAAAARDELRRLPVELPAPNRTGADLLALVERIRAGGTPVELTVSGEIPSWATDVVYRVVQESLTNVIRHAFGATARIEIVTGPSGVTVSISDDGPGSPHDGGRGYGLVGLGERVGFAGGSVRTGSGPGGRGFAVRAELPQPLVAAS